MAKSATDSITRLGILGGTFNPVHLAHLRFAEEAREQCALEQVLFIPAAVPPHKQVAGEVAFGHRLAMVQQAVADHNAFAVSDIEGRRQGKSYTVDTLQQLQQQYPQAELYLLIGMDSWQHIAQWHAYQQLFQQAHIRIAPRPGDTPAALEAPLPVAFQRQFCYDAEDKKLFHNSGYSVACLQTTPLAISSTHIRKLAAAGLSLRYLVSDQVGQYIKQYELYSHSRNHRS